MHKVISLSGFPEPACEPQKDPEDPFEKCHISPPPLCCWFQTTVTTFHLFQGILQNKGEVGGAMSVACRVI